MFEGRDMVMARENEDGMNMMVNAVMVCICMNVCVHVCASYGRDVTPFRSFLCSCERARMCLYI